MNLYRKLCLLFPFFLLCNLLAAQESTAILVALNKSNNNLQLHEIFDIAADPNEITVFPTSDQFGLAIRHQKANGLVFEAMVTGAYQQSRSRRINVSLQEQQDYSYDIRKGIIHLAVETGKLWRVPKHPSLLFGLAATIEPRITYNDYSSLSFGVFPINFFPSELSVNVVPQFSYQINNKFITNIKVPVEFLSYNYVEGRIDDPNLPAGTRKVSKHLSYFLPLYPRITLGVGYFFAHENR